MNLFRRIVFYGGAAIDLVKFILIVAVAVLLIHFFVGTIFIVSGDSMFPTFKDGQVVFSNKITYSLNQPARGDAVIVLYPGDPTNKKYIKRIVALPGEKIAINTGRVYIGNTKLEESYLPLGVESYPNGEWTLKNNEYFLMGDNRPNSNDSRYFGPVERRFLFGKASFIIWPDFREP